MLKRTKLLRLLELYGQRKQIPNSILLSVDLPLFLTDEVQGIAYDTHNNILFANEEYLERNKDRLNVLFLQKLLYIYLVHKNRLGKYNQFVKIGTVADYLANVVSLIEVNQFVKEYGINYQPLLTYEWFNKEFETNFPSNTPAETLAEYILQYADIVIETEKGKNEGRKQDSDNSSMNGGFGSEEELPMMSLENNEQNLTHLREIYSSEILEVHHKLKPDKIGDNLKISQALKGRKIFDTAHMTTIESNNLTQSLKAFESEYKLKKEVVFRPLKNALTSLFSGDVKKTFGKVEKRPYMAKYRGIRKGLKKTHGVHNVLIRIDISSSMNQEAIFKAIDLAKEVALTTETNVDVQGFGKYVINNKVSISELNSSHYSEKHLNTTLKRPTLARLSNKLIPVQFDDLDGYDAVIVIGDGKFAWGDKKQRGLAILLDSEQKDVTIARKVISVVSMKSKELLK